MRKFLYVAMISGYEETKAIGVYDSFEKALEVAEKTLSDGEFAYSSDFHNAYVAKSVLNGNLVSYMGRNADGFYEIKA